jgi:hypothetical protein
MAVEPNGSKDDIEDILDQLRALNIYFAVVVGIPEESCTRLYLSDPIEEECWDKISEGLDNVLRLVIEGIE